MEDKKNVNKCMKLYHGSEQVIKIPEFGKGKVYNDYGLGFYTTCNKDLAGEWATLITGHDGFINEYELDILDLNILYLDKADIKHWVAILFNNRKGTFEEDLRDIQNDFCSKYLLDTSGYDVIIGWRADDSYFSFVEDFALGFLSLENLQKTMKFGDLGQQVCLKSKKAFNCIKFVSQYKALASRFYQSAKDRDNSARSAYRKFRKDINVREGTLITDLI